MKKQPIRAISWWLTWPDLMWPDPRVKERVRRRADEAAKNGVNMAVIFGTHFRWDFMPLWDRLHALFAFIAEELHARDIKLFDHHSSCLVHRPHDGHEMEEIFLKNRHHLPFYPGREAAAHYSFNGDHLNDWRMINLLTGAPDFIPVYTAEEFCMNHPGFRAGYAEYLKRLISACPIDGLMSDDAIFDHGWETCGCDWCRKKFRDGWGHEIAPIEDASFWGNRDSIAFRDYVRFRFASSSDFLRHVRASLPPDLPLMTCCSNSVGTYCTAVGMSYQDFARHSDYVLLEMCGTIPDKKGRWDAQSASQALHMAIAREQGQPSIGLGYGFSEDSADFIWAVNRFLGSEPWFSTLKGRLDPIADHDPMLKDDAALVGHAYQWEQAHQDLLHGEPVADVAVFFSRSTRDSCAQAEADYVDDYRATCTALLDDNIPHVVVTRIPEVSECAILVMSSVIALSQEEATALQVYLESGGTVLATGPMGLRDVNAADLDVPFMAPMGIHCRVDEPQQRTSGFPPSKNWDCAALLCHGTFQGADLAPTEWAHTRVGSGELFWSPSRMQSCAEELGLDKHILELVPRTFWMDEQTQGWRMRVFRDGERWLIRGLAVQVETESNDRHFSHKSPDTSVISSISRSPETANTVTLHACRPIRSATLHSLDLEEPQVVAPETQTTTLALDVSNLRYHFILDVALADV